MLTRRDALLSIGFPLAAWQLSNIARSAEVLADRQLPLNRFPRMVQEFFVSQVRQAEQRHIARLGQLKSAADAQAYVLNARQRIRQSFGPEPERTALNPRITGTLQRDGYRVEKLIFDSRPGFPVTANVYIPNVSGRLPAVVGTCGHSDNGKAAAAYQSFAQGLAKQGFICLIYDPIGQGERLQYLDDQYKSTLGAGVREHLHAGNQQFLVGEFIGMWRAWDGIRALDYLLTRSDVDPQMIGVTGNSGGGTMTTWLCGVESRWSMAAPSCFVTTFRRNMENELPQDTEQCPPRALALGLDHTDFLAAMAPKPVIILAKEQDYFDVRGSEETYQRLKSLYQLLGAEDNIALFEGPTGHGYSQENREAMYAWFQRAADSPRMRSAAQEGQFDGVLKATGLVQFTPEPALELEDDSALLCTPQGQVGVLEGTRTVFDFTREKSIQLGMIRGKPRGSALKQAINEVLKLASVNQPAPDYRNWRYLGDRGYPTKNAMAYTIETEPGVQAIAYRLTDQTWHSRPPRASKRAILYVAHLSSDEELREEPLIRQVMQTEPNSPLFTCDVRGIGESLPETCNPGSFHSPYGSDYFYAIHSLMLDRPYVGQKTHDLLRVLDWLESLGHNDIHILGRGWGALAATFAAVLKDSVKQVTLKNPLTSYADLAETEHHAWPLSTLLPNVLASFDLPDCYEELSKKNLRCIDWSGPAGIVHSAEEASF
ncbi:MAG: acetylxylan esterase [Planctomycetales bacterium]|nr:acetylxylan esterase [Planctomycetales bacterium]